MKHPSLTWILLGLSSCGPPTQSYIQDTLDMSDTPGSSDPDTDDDVVTDTDQDPGVEIDPLEMMAGVTDGTWTQTIGGSDQVRHFTISVPDSIDTSSPKPIVFLFHGNAAANPDARPEQGMIMSVDALVSAGEFVAIAPRGVDNAWQLGPESSSATTEEELIFFEYLLERARATPGLDRERVYALGSSNGAAWSHYLAANTAHLDGIGTMVSGLDEGMIPSSTSPPTRVVQLMNFKDHLIPYEGGSSPTGHVYMSAEDSASTWASHNGCDATPEEADETTRTTWTFHTCSGDATVIHKGVMPVPWSEACESPPPRPSGIQCGGTHTIDPSHFPSDDGPFGYMWRKLSE